MPKQRSIPSLRPVDSLLSLFNDKLKPIGVSLRTNQLLVQETGLIVRGLEEKTARAIKNQLFKSDQCNCIQQVKETLTGHTRLHFSWEKSGQLVTAVKLLMRKQVLPKSKCGVSTLQAIWMLSPLENSIPAPLSALLHAVNATIKHSQGTVSPICAKQLRIVSGGGVLRFENLDYVQQDALNDFFSGHRCYQAVRTQSYSYNRKGWLVYSVALSLKELAVRQQFLEGVTLADDCREGSISRLAKDFDTVRMGLPMPKWVKVIPTSNPSNMKVVNPYDVNVLSPYRGFINGQVGRARVFKAGTAVLRPRHNGKHALRLKERLPYPDILRIYFTICGQLLQYVSHRLDGNSRPSFFGADKSKYGMGAYTSFSWVEPGDYTPLFQSRDPRKRKEFCYGIMIFMRKGGVNALYAFDANSNARNTDMTLKLRSGVKTGDELYVSLDHETLVLGGFGMDRTAWKKNKQKHLQKYYSDHNEAHLRPFPINRPDALDDNYQLGIDVDRLKEQGGKTPLVYRLIVLLRAKDLQFLSGRTAPADIFAYQAGEAPKWINTRYHTAWRKKARKKTAPIFQVLEALLARIQEWEEGGDKPFPSALWQKLNTLSILIALLADLESDVIKTLCVPSDTDLENKQAFLSLINRYIQQPTTKPTTLLARAKRYVRVLMALPLAWTKQLLSIKSITRFLPLYKHSRNEKMVVEFSQGEEVAWFAHLATKLGLQQADLPHCQVALKKQFDIRLHPGKNASLNMQVDNNSNQSNTPSLSKSKMEGTLSAFNVLLEKVSVLKNTARSSVHDRISTQCQDQLRPRLNSLLCIYDGFFRVYMMRASQRFHRSYVGFFSKEHEEYRDKIRPLFKQYAQRLPADPTEQAVVMMQWAACVTDVGRCMYRAARRFAINEKLLQKWAAARQPIKTRPCNMPLIAAYDALKKKNLLLSIEQQNTSNLQMKQGVSRHVSCSNVSKVLAWSGQLQKVSDYNKGKLSKLQNELGNMLGDMDRMLQDTQQRVQPMQARPNSVSQEEKQNNIESLVHDLQEDTRRKDIASVLQLVLACTHQLTCHLTFDVKTDSFLFSFPEEWKAIQCDTVQDQLCDSVRRPKGWSKRNVRSLLFDAMPEKNTYRMSLYHFPRFLESLLGREVANFFSSFNKDVSVIELISQRQPSNVIINDLAVHHFGKRGLQNNNNVSHRNNGEGNPYEEEQKTYGMSDPEKQMDSAREAMEAFFISKVYQLKLGKTGKTLSVCFPRLNNIFDAVSQWKQNDLSTEQMFDMILQPSMPSEEAVENMLASTGSRYSLDEQASYKNDFEKFLLNHCTTHNKCIVDPFLSLWKQFVNNKTCFSPQNKIQPLIEAAIRFLGIKPEMTAVFALMALKVVRYTLFTKYFNLEKHVYAGENKICQFLEDKIGLHPETVAKLVKNAKILRDSRRFPLSPKRLIGRLSSYYRRRGWLDETQIATLEYTTNRSELDNVLNTLCNLAQKKGGHQEEGRAKQAKQVYTKYYEDRLENDRFENYYGCLKNTQNKVKTAMHADILIDRMLEDRPFPVVTKM